MTHPEPTRGQPLGPGGEHRAHRGVGQRLRRRGGGRQQYGHAGIGRQAGRGQLGGHATRTQRAAGAGDHPVEILGAVDLGYQPGATAVDVDPARITVVEAVDVGEQDERIGTRQVGDERGQPVVVPETDLVGGHGVVLVHHRHGAE